MVVMASETRLTSASFFMTSISLLAGDTHVVKPVDSLKGPVACRAVDPCGNKALIFAIVWRKQVALLHHLV